MDLSTFRACQDPLILDLLDKKYPAHRYHDRVPLAVVDANLRYLCSCEFAVATTRDFTNVQVVTLKEIACHDPDSNQLKLPFAIKPWPTT